MTYFTPEELACPCARPGCDAPEPSVTLLARLNLTRDFYGQPMIVTSGVRCRWYNAQPHVGGADPSEHCDGDGADIAVKNSRDRYALVRAAFRGGCVRVGIGRDFVHLGVSEAAAFPAEVMWTYYPKP